MTKQLRITLPAFNTGLSGTSVLGAGAADDTKLPTESETKGLRKFMLKAQPALTPQRCRRVPC